jgi:hypothetical protein
LNSKAVSPEVVGLCVADVVVVVVALDATGTENAETAARMGLDYSVGHLN